MAGDAAQMMSPLLVKALIRFSQEGESKGRHTPADSSLQCEADWHTKTKYRPRHWDGARPLGTGRLSVDMSASGRFSLRRDIHEQFFFRSMATGVLIRAALISAVYKRALSLTVEARTAHPNGQVTTLVSSDVSMYYQIANAH